MAKYILVVPSSAKTGQDQAYNAWYDETHIGDLCAIPGVISGRRYDASPVSPDTAPASYLAIYEIETDDPEAVLTEIARRASTGQMTISPALDVESAKQWLYQSR